jgi:hypothetical protein
MELVVPANRFRRSKLLKYRLKWPKMARNRSINAQQKLRNSTIGGPGRCTMAITDISDTRQRITEAKSIDVSCWADQSFNNYSNH